MAEFSKEYLEEILDGVISLYQENLGVGLKLEHSRRKAIRETLQGIEEDLGTCYACGGSGGGSAPCQCSRCGGSGRVPVEW